MYQAQSRKENIVYVFDEFRLSDKAIETHPKLKFHGRVIETLNISLNPSVPVRDSRLIEILDDCITDPVRKYVANKCPGGYDNAVNYIWGLLEIKELVSNDNVVSVHVVEMSKR